MGYASCVKYGSFPSSCSKGCSPTLNMLVLSEKPRVSELSNDKFGSSSGKATRSGSSKCEHDESGGSDDGDVAVATPGGGGEAGSGNGNNAEGKGKGKGKQ